MRNRFLSFDLSDSLPRIQIRTKKREEKNDQSIHTDHIER